MYYNYQQPRHTYTRAVMGLLFRVIKHSRLQHSSLAEPSYLVRDRHVFVGIRVIFIILLGPSWPL